MGREAASTSMPERLFDPGSSVSLDLFVPALWMAEAVIMTSTAH